MFFRYHCRLKILLHTQCWLLRFGCACGHNIKLNTWHKIYYPHNFQVHSTVLLSIYRSLCRRSPHIFMLQNWSSIPIEQLPFPHSPLFLEATILLSVSKSFTALDTSYRQNHAVVFFLWLTYFTSHNILKVHLCYSI